MKKINKKIGYLTVLLCLFPWSSPFPIASDTQPLAFLLALIYLVFNVRKISIHLYVILFMLIGAIFGFIISDWADGLRGVYGYISMLVVSSSILHYFKHYGLPKYEFYKIIISIWGIVGVIQFWNPSIISFLSSRDGIYALSGGRGVNSFAPEPTFYAMFLILIGLVIIIHASNYKNFATPLQIKYLMIFIFAQIFLLSKSSLVLVFLIFSLLVFSVIMRPIYTILFVILSAPIVYILSSVLADSVVDAGSSFRLIKLLVSLTDVHIEDILLIDGSISDRVVQIITSHYNSLTNWLLPHGFSAWQLQANSLPPIIDGSYNSIEGLSRVLSLSGSLFFEVGFFALPFLGTMIYLIVKLTPGRGFRMSIVKTLVVISFLVQTIPLGLPTLAFLFSILLATFKSINVIHGLNKPEAVLRLVK